MDERVRRIGQNEALFREVNERLEAVNEAFGQVSDRVEIVCECGDSSCVQRLSLSLADYETVRSNPDAFVVANGHDLPSVEEVVASGSGWQVIRKHPGDPALVAEHTDPRS